MPRKTDKTELVHYHHESKKTSVDIKRLNPVTTIHQKKRRVEKYISIPPITEEHEKETYPSRYNRTVWSYNHVTFNKHKKNMLSLGFLMHRIAFIVIFCIAWISILFSLWVRYLMILSIIIGVLYLIISLYNFIIYLVNGSVIDDPHLIYDSHFRQFGERQKLSDVEFRGEWIPIDGDQTIFDDDLLPHLDAINELQEQHDDTGRFEILFYSLHYLENFVHFPSEIPIQGIIALITVIAAIVLPVLFHCSWGKESTKNNQICYFA